MWTSHHVIDDYDHLDFEITACGTQNKQSGSAVEKVQIYIYIDMSRRTLPNFDWMFFMFNYPTVSNKQMERVSRCVVDKGRGSSSSRNLNMIEFD